MTEGDKAYYKRRLREELFGALRAGNALWREAHLAWARYYDARLDGRHIPEPTGYNV